jgi:undecaprenyl-diphosphatase
MNINEIISLNVHNFSGKIPALDYIAKAIINYIPIIFLLIIIVIFILSIYKKDKKMRFFAINTGLYTIINLLLAAIISAIFYFPRPFIKYKFNPLLPHVDDSSFPSDHATLSISISIGFYRLNKVLSIILIIFSLILGLAKVYAGHHSVLDILCSYIFVFITRFIYNKYLAKRIEKIYFKLEKIIFCLLKNKKSLNNY